MVDNRSLADIPPLGLSSTLAFPPTAVATATALGAPTPPLSLPNTPAPLVVVPPTVIAGGNPALDDGSRLVFDWGRVIHSVRPDQTADSIA